MKRVLNSGHIKELSILGSEKDIFERADRMVRLSKGVDYNPSSNELMEVVLNRFSGLLTLVSFRFEVKLPLHTLQTFYKAQLGDIKADSVVNHQDAYLPPNFYKLGEMGFNSLDSKDANELNTKLTNFYNWSFNFYQKLREKGLCPEEAELILPQGMFSTIVWQVNALDLIKFVEQNYYKSPEIYGYCSMLVVYLEENIPQVVKWLKQNRWNEFLTI